MELNGTVKRLNDKVMEIESKLSKQQHNALKVEYDKQRKICSSLAQDLINVTESAKDKSSRSLAFLYDRTLLKELTIMLH